MDLYVSPAVPLGVDAFADSWSGRAEPLPGRPDGGDQAAKPGFPLQTRSRVEC